LVEYDYKCLSEIIPEFSYENALLLSAKYNFLKPTGHENGYGYWWDVEDYRGRLRFIGAMIEEIKK